MPSADPIPEAADDLRPTRAPQRILVGAAPYGDRQLRLKLRHSRAGDLWRLLRWSTEDFLVWSKRARRRARAAWPSGPRADPVPRRDQPGARRRAGPPGPPAAAAVAVLRPGRGAADGAAPGLGRGGAAVRGDRRRRRAAAARGAAAEPVLRPGRPSPAVALALPARDRPLRLPPEAAARIVVYTVLSVPAGRCRTASPSSTACASSASPTRTLAPEGWEVVPLAAGGRRTRASARHRSGRTRPLAEVAPEAEFSLFVAPDMLMIGNLDTLLTRWLLPHDLVLWRHADCIDWHDLAERHLVEDAPDPAATAAPLAQAATCEAAGLPRDAGACDSRVIWRRHGEPEVMALMEAWWRAFEATPGADDLALYRVLQDRGPRRRPRRWSAGIAGSARTNLFFARAPRGSGTAPRPPGRRGAAGCRWPSSPPRRPVLGHRAARRAALRHGGGALSRALRHDLYRRRRDAARPGGGADQERAARRSRRRIAAIRAKNVAVIACWDDDLPTRPRPGSTPRWRCRSA